MTLALKCDIIVLENKRKEVFNYVLKEKMEHYPNFTKNMEELCLKEEEIIKILKRNYEKWNEKRE